MASTLKNLKKTDRSLYDQLESLGVAGAYKAPKPEIPQVKQDKFEAPEVPKFLKVRNMMKPPKMY